MNQLVETVSLISSVAVVLTTKKIKIELFNNLTFYSILYQTKLHLPFTSDPLVNIKDNNLLKLHYIKCGIMVYITFSENPIFREIFEAKLAKFFIF